MVHRRRAAVTAGAAIALMIGTGCASRSAFRTNVADTDRRVAAVEDAIETTGRQVDDLGRQTDTKIAAVDQKAAQARAASEEAAAKADRAAKGKLLWDVTLKDDGVRFDFGQTSLSSPAVAKLDELIGKVKSYGKALYIEIEGHTDNVGNDRYNETLGLERAAIVRNYLNQKGIPLHAINTISYGESKPIADNQSRDGRALNRRVVTRVLE